MIKKERVLQAAMCLLAIEMMERKDRDHLRGKKKEVRSGTRGAAFFSFGPAGLIETSMLVADSDRGGPSTKNGPW